MPKGVADPPELVGTEIREEVVPQPVVDAQKAMMPPLPVPAEATLTADATRQYVSGNVNYFGFIQWFQSLPGLLDDVEMQNDADTYGDMQKDPKVWSLTMTLIMSALSQNFRVMAAVGPDDPNAERAQEMAAMAEAALFNLARPLDQTLREMGEAAMAFGNKVAEKVWQLQASGPWQGKLFPLELNAKPRRAVAFVVDRFMKVIGILGLIQPGGAFLTLQQIINDPSKVPNLLPRSKFAVLQFLLRDEDPRGVSWYRPIYTAWWRKLQTLGELMKHLFQLAGGMLAGTTAEKAAPHYQENPDGTKVLDATGRPIQISPEAQMVSVLQQAQNGAAFALPYGSTVQLLASDGGGTFLDALEDEDERISAGLTFQSLATGEAQHDTRAASETHQDVLALPVMWIRACFEMMVYQDLLRPLIEYNYGPEWVWLTPSVTFSDTPQEDRTKLLTALAAWLKAGGLDPEQLQEVDSQIGLTPRSDEAIQRRLEREEKADAAPIPGAPTDDDGNNDEGNDKEGVGDNEK